MAQKVIIEKISELKAAFDKFDAGKIVLSSFEIVETVLQLKKEEEKLAVDQKNENYPFLVDNLPTDRINMKIETLQTCLKEINESFRNT